MVISRARYSEDPTKLSRAAMRAADVEGRHTQVGQDGMFVTGERADQATAVAGTHLPQIQADFEMVLKTALQAINTRKLLSQKLAQAVAEAEPEKFSPDRNC